MNISAPLDELFGFVDEIQSWLSANRLISEGLRAIMRPLFELIGWKGQFADMFQEAVISAVIKKLQPIIDVIDGFLSVLNAVIDTIQEILEWLTNPIGSLIGAIGDLY